jgi:hypothetical protein
MWAQRMHHHDVVDVVVWPFDAIIQRLEFASCVAVSNRFDAKAWDFL